MEKAVILSLSLLAACAPALDIVTQVFPPPVGDPEPAPAVEAEIARLPHSEIVWQHRLDIPGIRRMTEGTDHLYVETADNRLIAVDKHDGMVEWSYRTLNRDEFRWAPVETAGVGASRSALERQFEEISQEIERQSDQTRLDYAQLAELRRLRSDLGDRIRAEEIGDHLYLFTHRHVICLDRRTGREFWMATMTFVPAAPPFATRAHLYIPAGDWSRVYVLDVDREGMMNTFYRLGMGDPQASILASPILWGDVLYVMGMDGTMYGFNTRSGDAIWTYPATGALTVTPGTATATLARTNPLGEVVTSDVPLMLVPASDRTLYAIDLTTRALFWRYEGRGDIREVPIEANGVLYAHFAGEGLVALESAPTREVPASAGGAAAINVGGRARWRYPGGRRYLTETNRGILVEGPDGVVSELDATNGRILAEFAKGFLQIFMPAPESDVLYVATPLGRLYALRRP